MRGVSRSYEECHKTIEGNVYKLCSICDEWLLMEKEFYKNKSAPDGYNPYCKECTKRKSIEWAEDNPIRRSYLKSKYDKSHDYIQQMKREWNIKNVQSGGYKKWQQENKDKLNEYNRKRKLHKEHDISNEEWENCKNYFNYRCAYCHLPIEEHYIKFKGTIISGDFHRDHVDHNGANDLSNCVPACKSCNTSKHDKLLENWYKPNNELWCNVYSYERLQKIYKWINEDYKKYIKE